MGPPFFSREAGVAYVSRAGIYAALQGIAASLGMIVGGWAHDRLARRGFESKTVIVAGLSALALSMLAMAAVLAQRSVPALAVLVFLAAFFCWSIWGAVYTLLGRMVRAEDLGAAFGLSNSISFLGAIIGPIATGWARDLSGSFSAGCMFAAVLAGAGVALVSGIRAPRQPLLAPAERRG
jgi:MFS transporter, ACS family, 4-hydroxyphenylacetate permease